MSPSTQVSRDSLIIYQENTNNVFKALKKGCVDYLDLSKWGFQDRFYAFLLSMKFFKIAGSSYPTPRVKEEIPIWFQLASQTQLKLHQEKSYSKLPGLLKSGPILSRLKFNIGGESGGFNNKNKKQREVPVDFDSVRKFFKDTGPEELNKWYNEKVIKIFHHNRAFDKRGIFIIDQTHIVVPDNKNYKGAQLARVDEHGQRIDVSKMTDEQKKGVKPRWCYSLSLLVHIGQDGTHVICGYKLGGGNDDELDHAPKLIEKFTNAVGKGVIKILIMDRGYISGEFISLLKNKYDIDVVVPFKKNMTAFKDSVRIAEKIEHKKWKKYRTYKKDGIEYEEFIISIEDIEDWESIGMPVSVSIMKTIGSDDTIKYWSLCTTFKPKNDKEAFDLYHIRSKIEEVNKQIKNNWFIGEFSSPHASLMEAHVLFTLLTYSLIQLYLMKKHLITQTNKTIETFKSMEQMGKECVIVYYDNEFAIFDLDYYTKTIALLEESAKQKLVKWINDSQKKWATARDG